MNEFFSWAILATFAGATGAVTLITQFVKWLSGDKLSGWATRAVSFAAALIVLFGAAFFGDTLNASVAVLTVLNAIVVTLAANGLFDNVKSLKG